MTAIKVRKGEYSNGRPCRWVNTTQRWQFDLSDLIDGLCSKFWRDRIEEDDDPLPEHLTALQIMEIIRDEYKIYGTNAVWTWSDTYGVDDEAARAWARRLILAVLPDLEIPKER